VVGRELVTKRGDGNSCEVHEEGVVVGRDWYFVVVVGRELVTRRGKETRLKCMKKVWLLGGIGILLCEGVVVMVGVL
jgi:hypothetical protein